MAERQAKPWDEVVSRVEDFDDVIVQGATDKFARKITAQNFKDKLAIDIAGIGLMEAGTLENPTILPEPSGTSGNKVYKAGSGFYSFNGDVFEAPNGNDWYLLDNGTSWSLKDMGELPKDEDKVVVNVSFSIPGGIRRSDGQVTTSIPNLVNTELLPIESTDKVKVTGRNGNEVTIYALFNKDNEHIYSYPAGNNGQITVDVTGIPDDARYIRATGTINVENKITGLSLPSLLAHINNESAKSDEKIAAVDAFLASELKPKTVLLNQDGYRFKNTGALTPSASAKSSVLLPINANKNYSVTTAVTGVNAAGVCYFNASQVFISSQFTSSDGITTLYEDEPLTKPEGAVYFAFSSHRPEDFILKEDDNVKAASKESVDALNSKVNDIDDAIADMAPIVRKQKGLELSINDLLREQALRFQYLQAGIEGDWYGVQWNELDTGTACIRIGSDMTLHVSLPLHNRFRRCVTKNGKVQYYLDGNNSNLKEDSSASNLTGVDGIVQVEIPECFYKVETEIIGSNRVMRLKLSESAIPDFKYSPKQYISAFEATFDNETGGLASVVTSIFNIANTDVKMESADIYIKDDAGVSIGTKPVATITGYTANAARFRGGVNDATFDNITNQSDTNYSRNQLGRPIGNLNREEFVNLASKTSESHYIYQYTAHQMLWIFATIEFANRNIQAEFSDTLTPEGYKTGGLGIGACIYPSYNAYEAFFTPQGGVPSIPCGTTVSLGNNSGVVFFLQKNVPVAATGTGASIEYTRWGDVYWPCVSYRGIEHPYGHSHKVVDNVNLMTSYVSGTENETLVDVDYYIQKNPFYTHNKNNNDDYEHVGRFRYRTHVNVISSVLGTDGFASLPINTQIAPYTTYYGDANEFKSHNANVHYIALGGRFSSRLFSGFLFHYGDYSVVTPARKPTFVTRICHR